MKYEGPTRFKGDSSASFEKYKTGADMYPRLLSEEERLGFRQKPFDWRQGHPSFLVNMFQLLNAIQAMELKPGATVVEVGSGAGWTTEILACLGYRLECVEPAELMLSAARERVAGHLALRAMPQFAENVRYHCTTFEEAALPDGSAAAVLFFESFHHVIDEHAALRTAYRVLSPDGALCILGDSNWSPGQRESESFWEEEMARFGTLESPFTHEYLLALLEHHGFVAASRHHGVNALVPLAREGEPAVNFAGHLHAQYVNLVLARKGERGTAPSVPEASAQAHVVRSRVRQIAASLLRRMLG